MSKPPPLNIGPIVITPDPVPPPKLPVLPVVPGGFQARPLPWNGSVPDNAGLDTFFKKRGVRDSYWTMTVIVLAATAQRNIEIAYLAELTNIKSQVDYELSVAIGDEDLSELETAEKGKTIISELLVSKNDDIKTYSEKANSFFGRNPLAKDIKSNAVDFVNIFQDWGSWAQPIDVYNNFIKSVSAAYMRNLLSDKIKILNEKANALTIRIAAVKAKVNEEALRLADAINRAELKEVPVSPPDVSIDKNIEHVLQLKDYLYGHGATFLLSWFYSKVKNKGEWDFKQLGRQYADFGNFHYGAVGTAIGLSEGVLLRAAGAAQSIAGTSKEEFDKWWSEAPYGDDPVDQVWIKAGIEYAKSKSS